MQDTSVKPDFAIDPDLTVDKDKFDALLRRMIEAEPIERKDIDVSPKKPGKIIQPQ